MNVQDFEDAINDFQKMLEIEVNNKAAQNQIQVCHHKIKLNKSKEKQRYAGMFDKFAKVDNNTNNQNHGNNDVFGNVNDWNNKMADGMMTIPQEAEAFGEEMPEPQFDK